MEVCSLGMQTSLMFHRFSGDVADKGDYLVVRTPRNPAYRWGHRLIFANPPGPGDFERWTTLFREEIGGPPEVNHMIFTWENDSASLGEAEPFIEAGFNVIWDVTLVAESLTPPRRYNRDVEVRRIKTDADYDAMADLYAHAPAEGDTPEAHRDFMAQHLVGYREMDEAGLGMWFGAFKGDQAVAGMGLFAQDSVGRYRNIVTHSDHRRQGIAQTMLYEATLYVQDNIDARTLVIVADPEYHALEIYKSLGFEERERSAGLERHQPGNVPS